MVSFRELLLLVALMLTPTLPADLGLLCLVLIGVLWLKRQSSHRELFLATATLVAAAILFSLDLSVAIRSQDAERLESRLEDSYLRLWDELDRAAQSAVSSLEPAPVPAEGRLEAFQSLADTAERGGFGATLYLLDPSGAFVAWAGAGLLHELDPQALPASGRDFAASFSAATLFSVEPLPGQTAGWRVVAGRSHSIDQLPFRVSGRDPRNLRWELVEPGTRVPEGLTAIEVPDTPTLILIDQGEEMARPPLPTPVPWRYWAWLPFGLFLLARVGLWLRSKGWPVVAYVRPGLAALHGASVLALVLWGSFWSQQATPPRDLAAALMASPTVLLIRMAIFAPTFALLLFIGRKERATQDGPFLWLGTGIALFGASAFFPESPAAAVGLVVAGGLALGYWIWQADLRRRGLGGGLTLALVALLAGATAWETAYHSTLRRHIGTTMLAETAPPTADEIGVIAENIEQFFAAIDLRRIAPVDVDRLDRQDLAFEIWHHSPLAGYGALSALVVFPDDGDVSSFGFGLPVTEESVVDWSPDLWPGFELPVWRDSVVVGEAELAQDGQPWGWARYWMVLRPGFRLHQTTTEDLAAGLLRGGPAVRPPTESALEPARYALYSPRGEPRVSPWTETPALPVELLAGGSGSISTPAGPATVFTARDVDGVRALFLPRLSPVESLERVAILAVGTGLILALLSIGALILILPGSGMVPALTQALRSYSKRLLVVYATLLVLPLLLMNLVVLGVLGGELERAQRVAGQRALESAQRVLGEYVLALEPGFGIDAALNNDVLIWLSRVVHHEVNLYWRGSVYASSKPELFTAGLLPKRIPGEIFSRLTLLGHETASRVNRTGQTEYLELYGPLGVPGIATAGSRLFLSIPLLAQEEVVSAEVASLRRKAVLGTTLLVLLMAAIGNRLARSFTRPLTEIVEGTQRIAAGERSLELAPAESELATLVEAIDRMAAKIDEGRQGLLREKQVVEGMVENITSAVVSIDSGGRVLLLNGVARRLLGLEVGESVAEGLGRDERLDEVDGFVAAAGAEAAQQTVELDDAEGEERQWSLVWAPVPGAGEPAALLVVEDVTDVIQSQRLQAWAEMARIIAHEIKNPLTPIRLSTEHMKEVYGTDRDHFARVFESCTDNILLQVRELQEIAREFSTYSRIPRIELRRGDVAATVGEIVDSYRSGPSSGVKIELKANPETIEADFDAKLLGRAVRNLLENALRATADGGTISVVVAGDETGVRISVSDDGPGIEAELLPRIFDPYFSTHDAGTGLGLPIARRIVEEHGGSISAKNRPQGGLLVTILLGDVR
jgi:signal transduction histidine kinase/HAMP domain-containing protein